VSRGGLLRGVRELKGLAKFEKERSAANGDRNRARRKKHLAMRCPALVPEAVPPASVEPRVPCTHAFVSILDNTATAARYGIGRADKDVAGYTPCPEYGTFSSQDDAGNKALALNQALGISLREAFAIVTSSIRAQNELRRGRI
jgi:hypothetical protein